MAKFRSKVLVSLSSDGGTTYLLVANRINVGGPNFTASEIDSSDMDSILKEYAGDLADGGSLSVSGNRNIGDAGQNDFRAAAIGTLDRTVKVEWLDPADDSVQETFVFLGVVLEFGYDSSSGSMNAYTGSIRVSGLVTIT